MNQRSISQEFDQSYISQTPEKNNNFEDMLNVKINSFDPIHHQKPQYNLYGQLINNSFQQIKGKSNILSNNPQIPEWFSPISLDRSKIKTRKKLMETRKKKFLPHPSYDLDGDGYVGDRDYVVAKRFDKDQDGILNEKEKSEAIKALKNGYENNFVWGLEQSGKYRHRILQRKGKFLYAEDFTPLTKVCPKEYLSEVIPSFKTKEELDIFRKSLIKQIK